MEDFTGWRARIGLVYMASSIVMEPEAYAMAPPGVSIHTARLRLPKVTAAGLDAMMAEGPLEEATALLAEMPLDVALFGGTSASFLHGLDADRAIVRRMERILPGVPATTTSTAALAALAAFGAGSITFVGPYVEEVTERGRVFFEENGIAVKAAVGLGLDADHAIGNVPLETVYRFARDSAVPGAEALFVSCTNLRTVGAIAALEEDLKIPVVTAIQASAWHAFRLAGVAGGRPGFGSLFGRDLP